MLKKVAYRLFIAERDLPFRLAENFPLYTSDKDVSELFDRMKGQSAIVVGGGPSLTDFVPWIKENRANNILIAVSTSLKALMAAGVVPDYVVAIDPQENMIKHFDGELPAGVPLVYVPLVSPAVLNVWKGPRYCAYMDMPWYRAMAELVPRGILWVDGTVSHVAADLAVKMGCDKVHLVGMDMAFPAGRSHVFGSPRSTDYNTHYAKLWMPNGWGEMVPTETTLAAYARGFCTFIAANPEVQVIKCGRNGVVFDGATWLDVDEHHEPTDHRTAAPSYVGAEIFDAYARGERNFSSADLRGLDARGAQLEGACLRWSHMEGADFSGADLREVDMLEAYCNGSRFKRAQLSQAKMPYTACEGADFEGAWMIDTCIAGANLERANLQASLLMGAWATASNMRRANLTGASTYYAVFVSTDFTDAQLQGTGLTNG